jgi:hypothetical protein
MDGEVAIHVGRQPVGQADGKGPVLLGLVGREAELVAAAVTDELAVEIRSAGPAVGSSRPVSARKLSHLA